MADTSVLIVGAGPTGLVLALWLTKQGVAVRIVDKTTGPGTTSRALAVHARTLELYEQLDLAGPVVAKGYTVPGVRLWLQGREAARVPFEQVASDLTPYGFLHIFPQDEHERLLVDRLRELGVEVERSTELLGYVEESRRRHRAAARAGRRRAHGDGANSSPAATARDRRCARSWAPAFQAAPIRRSSTSPTSPARGRRSTATSTSTSTSPTSSPCSRLPRKGRVTVDRHDQARPWQGPRQAHVRRRQRPRRREAGAACRQGELVLGLPRPSPGDRALPQGPRVPARRRRAHPHARSAARA